MSSTSPLADYLPNELSMPCYELPILDNKIPDWENKSSKAYKFKKPILRRDRSTPKVAHTGLKEGVPPDKAHNTNSNRIYIDRDCTTTDSSVNNDVNFGSLDPRAVRPSPGVNPAEANIAFEKVSSYNNNSKSHNIPYNLNVPSLKDQFFCNLMSFFNDQSKNINLQSNSQPEIMKLADNLVNIVFKPILT